MEKPKTVLWIERFNIFRTDVLCDSLEEAFDGETIIRFLDAVIDKIKPDEREKMWHTKCDPNPY